MFSSKNVGFLCQLFFTGFRYSFTRLSSAVGTIGALTTAVPRDTFSPHFKKKQRYPKKMVPLNRSMDAIVSFHIYVGSLIIILLPFVAVIFLDD
jgi:hypothetical protein